MNPRLVLFLVIGALILDAIIVAIWGWQALALVYAVAFIIALILLILSNIQK